MNRLRYEVYRDDNTGETVAAFRWLDDARAYAATLADGLVFDTQQQAAVTYFPREPAQAGGHDLRPTPSGR